ncbi:MAG: class I SAM-dependent methyltransferase [Patescibacteria group bacterium]|nr:class I SAM-dependent methyltransferase [Patescibacteria group bacterium]MDE2015237.1 class I SAM-dependent methyltransferase [Patescibacteria group bacterium]MDE2227043.1 class I SAM-dependent methyltransferase [Patescibacteria group bacterium]
MSDEAKKINKCRSCGFAKLDDILSLGNLYVSAFVDEEEQKGMKKYPLDLVLCNETSGGCGLLQLRHTVPSEVMYRNYWYRSGTNQTMTDALYDIVSAAKAVAQLGKGDFVIDIGANDGTLLSAYADSGVTRVGFEPARNIAPVAKNNAEHIINDFFNFEAWVKEFPGKKAKIITAIAMFYDLDDPNKFVADAAKCLDDDGVFIIQMSYLPLMLSQKDFMNICHEHLEYYSLLSLENLLKRHNLEVFDVETNDVNGGSFRVFIKHKNSGKNIKIKPRADECVEKMRADERALGLNGRKPYEDFVRRVEDLKRRTVEFIKSETAKGKKVYVYGASTKGNTLLQYYGLSTKEIPFAIERSQYKWGKKTVGSLVPIISEEQARAEKPDYFLILPWHFIKEFLEREKKFLEGGGKFIVPLPEFKILGAEDIK